ncbi:MAG: endonuclease/exonuclease/phosphatase family protein [Propionibacteriaceae bacterium]|jgi:endonuclease/exonuclease/phosphatase family metal-dependent hydrolase|nr:endonuclease/exonuclease/phosphatase family protein [Propionibacteriaceae bacterium]
MSFEQAPETEPRQSAPPIRRWPLRTDVALVLGVALLACSLFPGLAVMNELVPADSAPQRFSDSTAVITIGGQDQAPGDAEQAKVVIASYNIRHINPKSLVSNEHTWYKRRGVLVSAVLRQSPDVIGFQEASPKLLRDKTGSRAKRHGGRKQELSQFEDLARRLGDPYRLTNANRHNCVNPKTKAHCVHKNNGASKGVRIIYNSKTLKLIRQGAKKLPTGPGASPPRRYMAWAVFEQKQTGRQFFFADAHLDNGKDRDAGHPLMKSRVAQAKAVVAEIKARNTDGLPAFLVGDFNSSKSFSPANGPYDVFLKAGWADPLGNYWKSSSRTSGATVEHRINTEYSSWNGFKRKAPKTSNVNGSYLDYLLMPKGTRVLEWETVVDVDAKGDFRGIIPSDHNMIRATTYLP